MDKLIDFIIALVAVFISYYLGGLQQYNLFKKQNKDAALQKIENLLYFLESRAIKGNMANQAHDFILKTTLELLSFNCDDNRVKKYFTENVKEHLSLFAFALSSHSYNSGAIISINVHEVEDIKKIKFDDELDKLIFGLKNLFEEIKKIKLYNLPQTSL